MGVYMSEFLSEHTFDFYGGPSGTIPMRARFDSNGAQTPDRARVFIYDRRHADHGPNGQMISCYTVETFNGIKRGDGLDLEGGVASWSIDGAVVTLLQNWLYHICVDMARHIEQGAT